MHTQNSPSFQELKRFKHAKGDTRSFWFDGVSTPVVKLIFNTSITPVKVNFAATVVGLLMGLAFISGAIWGRALGLALFFLYIILDAVDGQLARARNDITLKGAYLDKIGHYLVYPVAGMAIGYGSFLTTGNHLMLWMGFLLGLSQTISSASRDSFKAVYGSGKQDGPVTIEYGRAGLLKKIALRLVRFETLLYLVLVTALLDRRITIPVESWNLEAVIVTVYAAGLMGLNLSKTYLFYKKEQLFSR